MRSAEEMVRAVHAQAGALRRRQAQARLALTGVSCGALSVALLAAIGAFGGLWHRPLAGSYAGASLLGESAGGYVLVAVAAFMLGVAITAYLKRRQGKGSRERDREAPRERGGSFLRDDALFMAVGGKKAHEDGKEEKPKGE